MNETPLAAEQAAEYLGVSTKTLKRWRSNGTGPAFSRLSRSRVRYRKSSLDAWLASREATEQAKGQEKLKPGTIPQDTKDTAMMALLDARSRVVSSIAQEAQQRLSIYSATGNAELAAEGAPWAMEMAKAAFQSMDPERPNMDTIKGHLAGELARRLYGEVLCIPEELHQHMTEKPGLPAWTERGLEGGMFYLAKAWGVAEVLGLDIGRLAAEALRENR